MVFHFKHVVAFSYEMTGTGFPQFLLVQPGNASRVATTSSEQHNLVLTDYNIC